MSSIKEKYFDFICSEAYQHQQQEQVKNSYQAHLQACYEDFIQSKYLRTSKRSKAVVERLNKEQKVK
jgi:hypothetical protein